MRYLDGGWLIQPGYQVSHATEVYDWRLGETADGRPCLFVSGVRAIPMR